MSSTPTGPSGAHRSVAQAATALHVESTSITLPVIPFSSTVLIATAAQTPQLEYIRVMDTEALCERQRTTNVVHYQLYQDYRCRGHLQHAEMGSHRPRPTHLCVTLNLSYHYVEMNEMQV